MEDSNSPEVVRVLDKIAKAETDEERSAVELEAVEDTAKPLDPMEAS